MYEITRSNLKNKKARHCGPHKMIISLNNHYEAKQSADLLQQIASGHLTFCKPNPFHKAFAMTPLFLRWLLIRMGVPAFLLMLTILNLSAQEIPFKPNEAFEITLDYNFRSRVSISSNTVNLVETRSESERKYNSAPLPYLIINVNIKEIHEQEKHIKVSDNTRKVISNRKLKGPVTLKIDMGFTADIKDGISPNIYYVTLLDDKKQPLSQIVFSIDQEGTFLVNNELRGKF